MPGDNEYMRQYMKDRWKKRRERYITQLGGKCVDCGSTESLNFDHVNPFEKSFTISKATSRSEAQMQEELKKCVLRCESCHKKKNLVDGSIHKNRAVGERIHQAKLSEVQVREIFRMEGSHASIARKYNVSRSTITGIKSGKFWKHLAL